MKDPITNEVIHPVTMGDAVYLDNGSRLEDNIRYCRNKAFEIGDLDKLLTTNKHTLVAAINEILTKSSNSQFGVRFVGSNSVGERIGDAFDLVAEPAYFGVNDIRNDFDNIYPWSEIKRCVINQYGEIVAYEGEPGFSTNGLLGDVFVEIPKFYQKCYKDDTNNYVEYWISSVKDNGFWLNPAFKDGDVELDHIYIGCYEGTYDAHELYSRAGSIILGNKTLAKYRELAQAKGNGFKLCDYYERNVIEYLFMIEYANRNTQDLYKGNCTASVYQTGMTDSLDRPSEGTIDTYSSPFRYRYMENIYGNVWEVMDGIIIRNDKPLICLDPTKYNDIDQYTELPTLVINTSEATKDFFISDRTFDAQIPYINLPKYNESLVSTNNTYYSDYALMPYNVNSVDTAVLVGGRTGMDDNAKVGLFTTDMMNSLEYSDIYMTARLCYKPKV